MVHGSQPLRPCSYMRVLGLGLLAPSSSPHRMTSQALLLMKQAREMIVWQNLQESPPAARNQPPMAGAIQWARALFARVRRTMDRVNIVQQAGMQHELMNQAKPPHWQHHMPSSCITCLSSRLSEVRGCKCCGRFDCRAGRH